MSKHDNKNTTSTCSTTKTYDDDNSLPLQRTFVQVRLNFIAGTVNQFYFSETSVCPLHYRNVISYNIIICPHRYFMFVSNIKTSICDCYRVTDVLCTTQFYDDVISATRTRARISMRLLFFFWNNTTFLNYECDLSTHFLSLNIVCTCDGA